MTVTFRIEAVRLDTTNGAVGYDFPGDLTVLAGHTGVGKTTLLELIKYGLGGDGLLAPVARDYVTDVHVSVHVGAQRLQLSRGLDDARRRKVRVLDLVTRDRLPDCSVGGDERPISNLLLGAMGLDAGLRAAARGSRSTSAGNEITFNDIFRFMYVPQSEMNRDIASSQDGYYNPKRKSVFELLFGLTSGDMLQMRSRINTLRGEIDAAENEAAIVRKFLEDAGLTSRFDAQLESESARADEAEAKAMLAGLQAQLGEIIDRRTQVLRDLLKDAESTLAEARALAHELRRQKGDYETERRRVMQDISRLARMASAGLRLASIEFSICPRCTQRLDQRAVSAGSCPVCLQPDIVSGLAIGDQYESEQLGDQLGDIEYQLTLIEKQEQEAIFAILSKTDLVSSLTAEIDQRTADRVTPRLQAYADAAASAASAVERQRAIERVLMQWDQAGDLSLKTETLAGERARLQRELAEAEGHLAHRKTEVFGELDAEFRSTVMDFGIPSITSASINPDSYLPILNGRPFLEASSGGGIITATQVAYWVSLVTVAARRHDTLVPAFLMLDSPRLALNAEDDIAGQMYRRFATQVAAAPGRFQFVIADNELPSDPGLNIAEIAFSYEFPTVSSIAHPGPASVEPLGLGGAE
jgi:hypothetical protein